MTAQEMDLAAQQERSVWTWIFNPFHYVAGGAALGIGLGVMFVAGILASFSHSHFDGALDFHTLPPELVRLMGNGSGTELLIAMPWWLPFAEALVGWVALSLVVAGAGFLVARSRFRMLDVFGTQALARFPMLFVALVTLLPGYQEVMIRLVRAPMEISVDPAGLAALLAVGLVVLVAVVWMIVLMYNAFAVSCNTSGGKAIAVFIGALIIGEVLSKVGIWGLFSLLEAVV